MPRFRALLMLLALSSGLHASGHEGFFRTAEIKGVWWLLDAKGNTFYASAANAIGADVALDKYDPKNPGYAPLRFHASMQDWAKSALDRLTLWNFNTAGAYSNPEIYAQHRLPYTIALFMGSLVGAPWVDMRDPKVIASVEATATEAAANVKNDPLLIGWFVDNELGWWDESMFLYFLKLEAANSSKKKLMDLVMSQYKGDFKAFDKDFVLKPKAAGWEGVRGKLDEAHFAPGRRPLVVEAFLELYADEYYQTMSEAMRKADPNHLLLGDRYADHYSQPIVKAAGKTMDVVSVNYDTFAPSGWISPSFFDTLHRASGKPLMVSEYYFAAAENSTGNKNSHGPYIIVQTQKERALGAREMAERFARLPYVLSAHWFSWVDEPKNGRGDGEDFNMGLVDIDDRSYPELTAAFKEVNAQVPILHSQGPKPDGLKRGRDGAWLLPQGAADAKADGDITLWNLSSSWLPSPGSGGGLPFGDFHLAWEPEGLRLGLSYFDFNGDDFDPKLPANLALLEIRMLRGGKASTLSVSGFKARDPKSTARRPAAPLSLIGSSGLADPGKVVGAQTQYPVMTMGELWIPAACVGGPLKPGERLQFFVKLSLRGMQREIHWPHPEAPAKITLAP